MHAHRFTLRIVVVALLLAACQQDGAANARRVVREQHGPDIAKMLLKDLHTHRVGLRRAATIVAPGFVRAEGEALESGMRQAMKVIRGAKKGVPELVISAMSFMAVVGTDGVVIARDLEPDQMKGMDLASNFPVVAGALQGREGFEVGEFENPQDPTNPSVSIVMAAPARHRGAVVGAVVIGIPLWRLAQRMSRQLQVDNASASAPPVLWVYLYRGERLFHHGTPPEIDQLLPSLEQRRAGLAASPGGYTGSAHQHSAWYGYGVRPLRVLGDDTGAIIFRMDPR